MFAQIIAHGDIDGMVSAALLISYHLKQDKQFKYRIRFSQPYSLHHTLNLLERVSGRIVYVLDISLDLEYWETMRVLLSSIAMEAEVTWIDHHPMTISHKEQLESIGIKVLAYPSPSTASLLKDLIPKTLDPEFSDNLVKLAELTDSPTPEPSLKKGNLSTAAEILTGAIALDPRDDELKRKIIESWVKKRILVPEEAVIKFQDSEEKLKTLFKEAKNRIIYESSNLRVIDLRDIRVYGFSGRIASKQANLDQKIVLIAFRIGQDTVVITGRAPEDSPVNLLQVFTKLGREWGVSGGGHYRAASLRIPASQAERMIRQLINELETSTLAAREESAN